MSALNSQSYLGRLIGRLLRFFFWILYNPFAWTYDWVAWIVSLGRWNDWVLSVMAYISGEPILEVGHGPGHLQLALLKSNKLTFGIDLSTSMGRITQKHLLREGMHYALIQGTAFRLPFPNDYFGSVAATFPSEYIANHQSLGEIYRILKPDGRLVILPFAWITGSSWLERLAAWLFRITGEAPKLQPNGNIPSSIQGEWIQQLANTARQLGFIISFHDVDLGSSKLMIVIAEKKNSFQNKTQIQVPAGVQ
jgi:ubiquinone/menaquinone biosynthesis C-methylase UbiE